MSMTEQLVEACRDLPVRVDVFPVGAEAPKRVAVLLPGGGLNARASFAVARGRSLVEVLAGRGYLPVGITPREDAQDPSGAAGWGLAAHRADAERVLAGIERVVGLPYDLLGHSAGAALALDLAAQPGCAARRVLVLDTTGPYDPATEPQLAERAGRLCTQFQQLLAAGERVLDPGLKAAFAAGAGNPEVLAQLEYALTRTAELPGPANWIYHRGHSAGGEALDLEVWARAMAALGSGVQPVALLRDLAALWGGRSEVYRIDWAAIRAEVRWVNAELGRGDHDLAPRLIRAGGARVDYRVVPGLGHGDVVWSPLAENAVWPLLLGE
ncbi:hypothetical protein ACFYNO_30445 [Kitasatospora sp. NPDC006697]|uniref:hypothetical protein n=1 Tax=Kitasatospora sp. NPDC006697 TaxID=3364020 RepID=UPI0036B6833A